jgi:hypothetical protein
MALIAGSLASHAEEAWLTLDRNAILTRATGMFLRRDLHMAKRPWLHRGVGLVCAWQVLVTACAHLPTTQGSAVSSDEQLASVAATGSEVQRGAAVFTIFPRPSPQVDSAARGCAVQRNSTDRSLVIGVIEFDDGGSLIDSTQRSAVLDCITDSRQANNNGVTVVVFAHGWHHNAAWDIEHDAGDSHFKAFRQVMIAMMRREAERLLERSVVGVYLGWRGETHKGPLNFLTFKPRLNTAERIGNGDGIRDVVLGIVERTKGQAPDYSRSAESPLIFAGHSMGALIIESAFLSLLRDDPDKLLRKRKDPWTPCATVRRGADAVVFPDLVLLLNAATDSRIATQTAQILDSVKVSREIQCGRYRYSAPVFVSVTSEVDTATGVWFPLARKGHKTEGHESSLITHTLKQDGTAVLCSPKPDTLVRVNFNQSWHCLRHPDFRNGALVSLAMDLPQVLLPEDRCHLRYRLTPVASARPSSFWNFQVPRDVMGGHSDVFNARSTLFVMALAQASGGVLSIAREWKDVFEEEREVFC